MRSLATFAQTSFSVADASARFADAFARSLSDCAAVQRRRAPMKSGALGALLGRAGVVGGLTCPFLFDVLVPFAVRVLTKFDPVRPPTKRLQLQTLLKSCMRCNLSELR